jgi:hypothetical protein
VKKTFEEIKKIRPSYLYISVMVHEMLKKKRRTDAVRDYIMKNVDWKCDVKTLFREKNLGCKLAVADAVTWFFKNVEQGIILEDDCLPSQSFFGFCEEILDKYKDDRRVMHFTGTNLMKKMNIKEKLFFYEAGGSWGVGNLERAWE